MKLPVSIALLVCTLPVCAQDLAALSAEVGHIARLQAEAAGRQRQVA